MEPYEVFAPGAFRNSVGRTVPVVDENREVIGTAVVVDEDGQLEITLDSGEVSRRLAP